MQDRSLVEDKRRNSFDAVRMAAALGVVIGHQFDLAGYYIAGSAQPRMGPLGLKLSDAGLYVFFALSGYLVFQSLQADPRPGRFLAARVLRIYPGAMVNTLLCLLFGAIDTTLSAADFWHDPQTWSFLSHNLLILTVPTQFQLPGVLADARYPAVNVPIWTLKYEILSYLMLLAIYKAAGLLGLRLRPVLIGVAVLMTAAFLYTRLVPQPDVGGTGSLGPFFLAHSARFYMVFFAGSLYAAGEPLTDRTRLAALLVPGLLIVFGPSAEFGRAGILLLLALIAIEVGKSSLLHADAVRRIGDLSYGTYLYAFPIQLLTLTRWLGTLGFWGVTIIDIGLILACAFVSWHVVEHPALRLKRARRGTGPPRQARPDAVPSQSLS